MRVRKAKAGDVKAMHSLINKFAKKDEMLPRSLTEIYENIRDFFVCTQGEKIKGTAALHVLWEDLAEIRSVAVLEEYQRSGIGKKLIDQCIMEAGTLGIKRIFALTYYPAFFKKMGFEDIDKNDLPQKIWGDCLKCPLFPECEEVAVIKELKGNK